mgnify:CR=1 FL=1
MANHPYLGLAVALSFILPGLGQIYNQEFGKGVRFIIAYIISWALSFIGIGWFLLVIVWVWSMVDAYQSTRRVPFPLRRAGSAPGSKAAGRRGTL